ncbi:MAG TPA: hypothetical protein VGK64_14275, partial [Bryobacteraceae bacterium]
MGKKVISRREWIGSSALSFGAVLFGDASGQVPATPGRGPAIRVLNLDRNWLFGEEADSKGLAQVT